MNKNTFIKTFLNEHHLFIVDESISHIDQDSKIWIIIGNDKQKRLLFVVEFDENHQMMRRNESLPFRERVAKIEISDETKISIDENLRLIICSTHQRKNIYSMTGTQLCQNVDDQHLELFKKEMQTHFPKMVVGGAYCAFS